MGLFSGIFGGAPKPPAQPDPWQTAAAQGQWNINTALANQLLNQTNQVTPYGSVSYSSTPRPGTGVTGATPSPTTPAPQATPQSAAQTPNPYANAPWMTPRQPAITQPQQPQGGAQGSTGFDMSQIPQFTQTTTLNPAEQKILDTQRQGTVGSLQAANKLLPHLAQAGQPIDLSTMPGLTSSLNTSSLSPLDRQKIQMGLGNQDYEKARTGVEDAVYRRQQRTLDPYYQDQQKALDTSLLNRGFSVQDQGYGTAMDRFGQGRDRAYQDARDSSIIQGAAEQNQLFNQALGSGQFANQAQGQAFDQSLAARTQGTGEQQINAQLADTARNRLFNEALTNKMLPINQFTALRSGQQVNMPQPAGIPQSNIGAPDIQGGIQNQYKGQMDAYDAKVGQQNANAQQMGQMAMMLAMSDIRLKENIRRVGAKDGIPVYTFRYKGKPETYRGVMAQDILGIKPEAVQKLGDYYAVDYSQLPVKFERVA